MKYNYGEHIVVVGKTQSGKTYYVKRELCRVFNNYVVFSEEAKDTWEDVTEITVHSVKEIEEAVIKLGCKKIFYEPIHYKNPEDFIAEWDNLCKYVFENLENVALINDEVADVSSSMKIEPYHFKLIRKGAKRNITLVSATQRPQQVNKTIWTQSKHKLIFKVDLYEGDWLHDYILDVDKCMSIKEDYHFYYDDTITSDVFVSKTLSLPHVEKKEKELDETDIMHEKVGVTTEKESEKEIRKEDETEKEKWVWW